MRRVTTVTIVNKFSKNQSKGLSGLMAAQVHTATYAASKTCCMRFDAKFGWISDVAVVNVSLMSART
jgi:hypothetical protein